MTNTVNVVGFFPGLGSRSFYQNVGDDLLKSGDDFIEQIYHDSAVAMGYGERPEKMLITSATLPKGKMERQGFIGSSFLTHNLVLVAQFCSLMQQYNQSIHFVAHTGESFGLINAAVASGALSIGDGVKIANFFTPYILLASECDDSHFSQSISNYYPHELKEQNLIKEPYYVVALRGREKKLAEAYIALQNEFLYTEIEKHKVYSRSQINLYVKASIKSCFDIFMKKFPSVEVIKLKEPTKFITHSKQLTPLIQGLERFIVDQQIKFLDPHTPLIANHCENLLTHKDDIRSAILAIVDQVMLSSTTARMADKFDADAIIEFGVGNKSVQMLRENEIRTPAFSFPGETNESMFIMRAFKALNTIRGDSDVAQICTGIDQWIDLTRENAKLAASFYPKITEAIQRVAPLELNISGNVVVSIDSIYKNTWLYREFLQSGERVMMARLRRNIHGDETDKHQSYADLKIITNDGLIRYQKTPFIIHEEKTLFYFSNLDGFSNADVFITLQEMESIPDFDAICSRIEAEHSTGEPLRKILQLRILDAQPEIQAIRRIVIQLIAYEMMKTFRPGLVQASNIFLTAHDFIGWLACLVISGAVSLDNITLFCCDYYTTLGRKKSPWAVVKKLSSRIINAKVPILSVNGLSLLEHRDLEINTYKILLGDYPELRVQIALDCHVSIITLDRQLSWDSLNTAPYQSYIILISSIRDIWSHNPDSILEQREIETQAHLTEEYLQVSRYAGRRNLLCGTINAYIEADEVPVLFCHGGSESMTMFIQRSPVEPIVVRKVLSEALTAAKWSSNGKGVMLPPFAKAARQVEYLRALPERVKPWFPQVYNVTEREILTPVSQMRVGKATCKEVIYEMSLVEGEEVSKFIYHNKISPQIVARLYEIIFIFLRDNVHREKRVVSEGNTLEISYFRKIEDRLELCQQTAPGVFCPELLSSEKIIINGTEYLNIKQLLNTFRSHHEYLRQLEPLYHSLVMGDTNTENIKINNTAPLLEVQNLINQKSSEEEIAQALEAINADQIELRFLDPRAIGYKTEGDECRDDYMYDNKPWHNSLGHYDELHNELFTLDMKFNDEKTPVININFTEGNEYQQTYQITDCVQKNINPSNDQSIVGMEKYFSKVMNNVYDSTNPDSIYIKEDPYWLVRFVFIMGTHFAAMPPFHFSSELDGTIKDSIFNQRRPVAIYCEGIKWLNWSLAILQGTTNQFLGVSVPFVDDVIREVL